MATCDATTLLTNAAGYDQQQCNPKQQKALMVFGMLLELQAGGGTDYRNTAGVNKLLQDAQVMFKGYSPDQLTAAQINLQFLAAKTAGATVPGGANVSPPQVMLNAQLADNAMRLLVQANDELLMRAYTLLFCQLGA